MGLRARVGQPKRSESRQLGKRELSARHVDYAVRTRGSWQSESFGGSAGAIRGRARQKMAASEAIDREQGHPTPAIPVREA